MINSNQNKDNSNLSNGSGSTNSGGSSSNQNKPQTYKVIKLIGEGAFGRAYLVECNSDRSLCVIKTINIDNMSDQEKKETLLEAKILEKLDHPNIIRFREVFIAKKPRFTLNIVTDYADGGDLSGKIKSQKGRFFSENQILDWFTQICLALKHIHDKKILHRDLKSQNIFLTENGIIKLGDFGIAKCLECTWEKAMTVVGTPYYLSPEIVNNKPYSFKSDIWSLGVLLYEMTALKMPFDATSLPMLSLKIIKGNYIPLPQNFSRDLRNLVGMLLIVDYNKRPSINEILKMPIIKTRIKSFLNDFEYNKEFSHTIIHNYKVLKDKAIVYKPSSQPQSSSNSDNNVVNIVNQEVKKNIPSQLQPQPQPIQNKNIIINKPQSLQNLQNQQLPQKRDSDSNNKEIAAKLEMKKKTPVNPLPVKQEVNKDIKKLININYNQQINVNKEKSEPEVNPLQELMKKARSELKTKPKDDVIWIGNKEKEVPQKKKEEKELKFPKVIILEKPEKERVSRPSNENAIDVNTPNQVNPGFTPVAAIKNPKLEMKEKKTQEELYNLNRILNELAKIENEEENETDSPSKETNIESRPSIDEERDFNEIEEIDSSTPQSNEINSPIKKNLQSNERGSFNENSTDSETNTDNTQIEELRIELENSLGFELFKRVYQIVEQKTDPYLFKCDFELLKEIIIKELAGRFDKKIVDSALEKIPEIFAIVVRERVSNFK